MKIPTLSRERSWKPKEMKEKNLIHFSIARVYGIPFSRDLMIDVEGLCSERAAKFVKAAGCVPDCHFHFVLCRHSPKHMKLP